MSEVTRRTVCTACSRPTSVCLCAALAPVAVRTRIIILQHPRESDVAINTARLAQLQLLGCERHVAVALRELPELERRLFDPDSNAILLYPSEDAPNLAQLPEEYTRSPVTLVVVDGTWWQAQKLLKNSPELLRLPRYGLSPEQPSRYRIRKEPALHCVSTIEAIGQALSLLEGPSFDRERLLRPFELLVEQQLAFAAERSARRHLLRRASAKPKALKLPALLARRSADLVVGYGETNAWPKGTPLGAEPEMLHWAAERVESGERFEALIAPRRPLSPSFPHHAGIASELVLAGESFESFVERWQRFVRPSDLLVGWGHFSAERLRSEGVLLPERVDLRLVARHHLRGSPGDVVECAQQLGASDESPPWAPGRTGRRLAAAAAVTRALLAVGR